MTQSVVVQGSMPAADHIISLQTLHYLYPYIMQIILNSIQIAHYYTCVLISMMFHVLRNCPMCCNH